MNTATDINALQTNKLYFFNGIMDVFDGRQLHAYKPNKDGYYEGVPLGVFNEKSFNGCYYDTASLMTCLTQPKSSFSMRIMHGNLYGEWGHPDDDVPLERIAKIDKKCESHHIRTCYTDKSDTSATPIIRGDLRPSGPYGEYLERSLLSPSENTSFSLRCLMTETYDNALKAPVRTVVDFITFDAVDMPGYIKASKWYAPSYESFREITLDQCFDTTGKRVALEGYSDQTILNFFGIEDIKLQGTDLGHYLKGSTTYIDTTGTKRSLTQAVLAAACTR